MGARTGNEYLENLRRCQPEVWLGGRRVEDVTTEPAFAGTAGDQGAAYVHLGARFGKIVEHRALDEGNVSGIGVDQGQVGERKSLEEIGAVVSQ